MFGTEEYKSKRLLIVLIVISIAIAVGVLVFFLLRSNITSPTMASIQRPGDVELEVQLNTDRPVGQDGQFYMGPWPSATALQYCGAPGTLRNVVPSVYNDWTVVRAQLMDPLERWVEQMTVFGDDDFWGYINLDTPEDVQVFTELYTDSAITDVFGVSSKRPGEVKAPVCSVRPGMMWYVTEASKAYADRGLEGLIMDMTWNGFNTCAFDYDKDLVEGFAMWLQENVDPAIRVNLGLTGITESGFQEYARSIGADAQTRADVFDPVINLYTAYLDSIEQEFFVEYAQEMDEYTQAHGGAWDFTLNRPNAAMFLVIDALNTVRHETFVGRRIHDPEGRLDPETRRYPDRNMIPEFKLFADHGHRLWSSNTPHFELDRVWQDNLLFMAETYAAGGIGFFPTTEENAEWGQTCAKFSDEEWVVQADQMLEPLLRVVSSFPDLYGQDTALSNGVALLYPLDSNLYGQKDLAGWDSDDSHRNKQDESFIGAGLALQDMHIPYTTLAFGDGPHFAKTEFGLTLDRLEGYDVVILPSAWSLSDSQLAIFQDYAARGGTLFTLYKAGTHDEYLIDRFEQRSAWNARVHGPEPVRDMYGEGVIASSGRQSWGMDYFFYKDQRESLRSRIMQLVPELAVHQIQTKLPPEVNILPYEREDGSLVLHALNYAYSRDTDKFQTVPSSELWVERPGTDGVLFVQAIQLDGSVASLQYRVEGGELVIEVPKFDSYIIINIGTDILKTHYL